VSVARAFSPRVGPVEPFLEHCLATIRWSDHDIVGFASTFEESLASLALARRVKALDPRLVIVFGGANWEGEMGQELHRRFLYVDVVCAGEADESFPAAVEALAAGRGLGGVRGIVHRDGGRTVATAPAPLVRELDELPIPDYDEFVAQQQACPATADVIRMLMLETGRGCWWGAKSRCTLCGLDGPAMSFRANHPDRALAEIHALRDRYGVGQMSDVDNILDMRYFRTLLPSLAAGGGLVSLFHEVEASLSTRHVAMLAAAGVGCIQPGIRACRTGS
jgi:ribosomal peptide maturation radical SAM protein 1